MELTQYYLKEYNDGKVLAIGRDLKKLSSGEIDRAELEFNDSTLIIQRRLKDGKPAFELLQDASFDINVIPHTTSFNRFMHFHDFFEIMYIYKGSCRTVVDGKQLMLKEGDLCLFNLQALHSIETINPEIDIFFNILISQSTLDNVYFKLITGDEFVSDFFLGSIETRRKKDNYVLFCRDSDNCPYENLIQHIIYEHYDGVFYKKRMFELLLTAFLIELAANYRQRINIESSKDFATRDISEIIQYIIDHCENVNIGELAERFHYQPSYLSMLIKKYSGNSFSEILHDIRFKKASLLLMETNLTVTDIMEAVGYSNRTWFTKKFEGRYNLPPSEYRKKFKK